LTQDANILRELIPVGAMPERCCMTNRPSDDWCLCKFSAQ
jgi:hypothetical protein